MKLVVKIFAVLLASSSCLMAAGLVNGTLSGVGSGSGGGGSGTTYSAGNGIVISGTNLSVNGNVVNTNGFNTVVNTNAASSTYFVRSNTTSDSLTRTDFVFTAGSTPAIYVSSTASTNPLVYIPFIYNLSNRAPFTVIASPNPAVLLGTFWTNTYGCRVKVKMAGTYTTAVGSTVLISYTNNTSNVGYNFAGSTLAVSGVWNWKFDEDLSTNDIILLSSSVTGTGAAALTRAYIILE